MYNPDIRLKYDSTIKEYKILEKTDNYCVFKTLFHSPIFFIPEKDILDKRIEFVDDNMYYNLATSVDDYEPLVKSAVRIKTYLNLSIISQDDKNYYFECYSQYGVYILLK